MANDNPFDRRDRKFGEVILPAIPPDVERLTNRVAPPPQNLGPLENLLGLWIGKGTGWNMIALPFQGDPTGFKFRVLMNQYNEELQFTFIGRRVPSLLRAAGLVDVQVRALIHAYPPGHGRRLIRWQFMQNLRERLLAAGLVTEAELTQLMAELKYHLDDPNTLMVSNLFLQVWGRKPG